jgi:NAD(P)-dependent dehydrogenase (short-subunit alcohol dehydrogenase family)
VEGRGGPLVTTVRFQNKLAVVTGANSGIGRATAVRLLEEGADVVAVDCSHDAPWPTGLDARVTAVAADVADPLAPGAVLTALENLGRGYDILVNAAGILRIAPFFEVTETDWDDVLAVNLKGVFFLTQAIGRGMVERGTAGRIVNVSSVHAVVSEPNAAPYTASKGGLEALTRTIATELAPYRITVNCVRPGATWTAMSRPIYTERVLALLAERIPLKEIAPPEWVATAICYLASDESMYTTGACLDVDGGYAMNGALPGIAYE